MKSIKSFLGAPIRLLPETVPTVFLQASFLIAFVVVIFINNSQAAVTYPVAWRFSLADMITYLFDPILVNLITMILCGYLVWSYLQHTFPAENKLIRLYVSFGLPAMLIVFSYLVEQYVLKPAFRYPRPGSDFEPLKEPWLTHLLRPSVPTEVEVGAQDVPSGFALRQMIIFYLNIWILEQHIGKARWLSKNRYLFSHIANTLALIYVFFSRLYRADHSIFAISVAIGVSTLLFWLFLISIYFLSNKYREQYRPLLSQILGIQLVFLVVFLAYSNDAGRWLFFSVVILVLLASAYMFFPPGAEPSEEVK